MKEAVLFFHAGRHSCSCTSVLTVHTGAGYATLPALIDIYPYIVYPAAVLVGWRFSRSSLVFAAVLLAVADRTCLYF